MMSVTTESTGLERWLPGEKKTKNEIPCWAVGCRMSAVKDIRLDLGGRAPSHPQRRSFTSGLGPFSISCLGQKSVSHPGLVSLLRERLVISL